MLLDADVDERARGETPGRKFAAAHCAECKRAPAAGEVWRLHFVDLEEVAPYCPSCAKRAFGDC